MFFLLVHNIFFAYQHKCDPPLIPYLGMYLMDLVFIEESTPDTLETNLVNFSKLRMVSHIIRDIRTFQHSKYTIHHNRRVHIKLYIHNYFRLHVHILIFLLIHSTMSGVRLFIGHEEATEFGRRLAT